MENKVERKTVKKVVNKEGTPTKKVATAKKEPVSTKKVATAKKEPVSTKKTTTATKKTATKNEAVVSTRTATTKKEPATTRKVATTSRRTVETKKVATTTKQSAANKKEETSQKKVVPVKKETSPAKKSTTSVRSVAKKEPVVTKTGTAGVKERAIPGKKSSSSANRSEKNTKETTVIKRNMKRELDEEVGNIGSAEKFEKKINMDELGRKIKESKSVSGRDKVSIFKCSFYNILYAFVFILFLVFCNYGFYNINKSAMIKNINLFSFLFLGISVMLIESAYKEDKFKKCVNGVEVLVMGIFTLILPYILQTYTEKYIKVLVVSGIVSLFYYFIKSVIAFFINRRNLLIEKDNITKERYDNEFDEDDD